MPSKTSDSVGNARKPPQSVRLPLTRTPKPKPIKHPGPLAPNPFNAKLRGELVEMMFMLQASLRGLIVAKPYGDSRRYDFITDTGRRLCRVQVKSSAHRSGNGFVVNATSRRHSREVYTAAEIDFLIAYIIPRNAWYIIPVAALHASNFMVYPDGCRRGAPYAIYDQYRQAWRLLGASTRIPGFDLEPPLPVRPIPKACPTCGNERQKRGADIRTGSHRARPELTEGAGDVRHL